MLDLADHRKKMDPGNWLVPGKYDDCPAVAEIVYTAVNLFK
jgi:hypothetical protein